MKKFCYSCGKVLFLSKNPFFDEETGKPIPTECHNLSCFNCCEQGEHKIKLLRKRISVPGNIPVCDYECERCGSTMTEGSGGWGTIVGIWKRK